MATTTKLYDGSDSNEISSAVQDLSISLAQLLSPMSAPASLLNITPNSELLGVSPLIYDLISQALRVKKHLMLYGPPGTGKTTLAEYVAKSISGNNYILATGSSDWSSQDLVGGYQPVGNGKIKFVKGLVLENFDKPIIIDELNRVDIDKAIGPLFTVLSGQQTTLPYQLEPDSTDPEKLLRINILPEVVSNMAANQMAPTDNWRLIATINSIDKASLFQMSYALSRRFAWILIDVPEDLDTFVNQYLQLAGVSIPNPSSQSPISKIWLAVNKVRPVGAAPIIDIIKLCLATDPSFDFYNTSNDMQRLAYVNGFYAFLLPLMDGILKSEGDQMADGILDALTITSSSVFFNQIKDRISYHSL
jgi:MoxR-like ATPase